MRTAYIAALGLVCTVSLAAYAAEPKPHPSSDKSTTESTTADTVTTDEKGASKAKHSCPEGQAWLKTCQKHSKNGEKCMKVAWGCSPSPDVPQPAPEPANPLPEEK